MLTLHPIDDPVEGDLRAHGAEMREASLIWPKIRVEFVDDEGLAAALWEDEE